MTEQIALDVVVDALRSEVAGRHPAMIEPAPSVLAEAMRIARTNKVLSLVGKRFSDGSCSGQLLADAARTMVTNTRLLEELGTLLPHFDEAGVKPLIIKGPVQQKQVHGTFFQRASADLDILVRAQDFARARTILVEAGYWLATPSVWWQSILGEEHFRKRAVPHLAVDLHHRVHQPGAPAPYDAEHLFAATQTVRFEGIEIPTLSAFDGMLLCTISIAKALYNREPSAAYLCDLYVWLMAAAPGAIDLFRQRAASAGLGGHARHALCLMDALLGSQVSLPAERRRGAFGVDDDSLMRMILVPRDPATRWPRRRDMLWELCERQPTRYGREFVRVLGSELMRRLFERGAPA